MPKAASWPRATAGQAGNAPGAEDLLEELSPGATLIADRAYDTNAIRALATDRSAWANIPPRLIRKDAFSFSGRVFRQGNIRPSAGCTRGASATEQRTGPHGENGAEHRTAFRGAKPHSAPADGHPSKPMPSPTHQTGGVKGA